MSQKIKKYFYTNHQLMGSLFVLLLSSVFILQSFAGNGMNCTDRDVGTPTWTAPTLQDQTVKLGDTFSPSLPAALSSTIDTECVDSSGTVCSTGSRAVSATSSYKNGSAPSDVDTATEGTYTVTVEWKYDGSVVESASYTVEVTEHVIEGDKVVFNGAVGTLTLSGASSGVTWDVTAGSIDSSGVWTPPSSGEEATVTATYEGQDYTCTIIHLLVSLGTSPTNVNRDLPQSITLTYTPDSLFPDFAAVNETQNTSISFTDGLFEINNDNTDLGPNETEATFDVEATLDGQTYLVPLPSKPDYVLTTDTSELFTQFFNSYNAVKLENSIINGLVRGVMRNITVNPDVSPDQRSVLESELRSAVQSSIGTLTFSDGGSTGQAREDSRTSFEAGLELSFAGQEATGSVSWDQGAFFDEGGLDFKGNFDVSLDFGDDLDTEIFLKVDNLFNINGDIFFDAKFNISPGVGGGSETFEFKIETTF